MKIKKLTIKNVASIESAELDFENGALGDAPLFLICGETGSGKTTILDCLTLALYGKTPRYCDHHRAHDRQIGRFAYNDALQLVRHGAREAWAKLELIGNDGKPYVASWTVTSGRQARTRDRLSSKWSWRDCSAGGLTVERSGECEAVVRHAVGLEFSQFCRTTMLAQGQFTKFLLGSENEKAEILEKLTDTSRYSELGKAIAARYKRLEDEIAAREKEIAAMSGLGEERAQVEARLADLSNQMPHLDATLKKTEEKLQWLKRRNELEAAAAKVRKDFDAAFPALKALDRKTEAELQAAERDVAALRTFLDANAAHASAYDQADVILTCLQDARIAYELKAAAERELKLGQQALPELEKKEASVAQLLRELELKVSAAEGVVNAEEETLKSMGAKHVQAERNRYAQRRGELLGLEGEVKGAESLKKSVAVRLQALARRREEADAKEAALPELQAAAERAHEALVAAEQARDCQRKRIDDGIEKLVADLHVGETCPICGNKIEKLQASGYFESLFRDLDKACEEAKVTYGNEERHYQEAAAEVKAARAAVVAEGKAIASDEEKVRRSIVDAAEAAKCLGARDSSVDALQSTIAAYEGMIAACDAKLGLIEKQREKIDGLKKGLKKLTKSREATTEDDVVAQKALSKGRTRIENAQRAIATEHDRAELKLAEVSGKVSIEDWRSDWVRDPLSWEESFKTAADDYVARREALRKADVRLDRVRSLKEQVARCVENAAAKIDGISAVEPGERVAESTAEVDGLMGRVEQATEQLEAHCSRRPTDWSEDDTLDSLQGRSDGLRGECKGLNAEMGALRQRLEDDDRRAADRRKREEDVKALVAERDEWQPIYNYYGDNDGSKIRREIQSYVLDNVLTTANFYLRQLSERYVLSSEGLMLSVFDGFEGGVVRPVNTLSGGEQFLVSLALALGLAGMNDTGLSVDMLLIDEGFGTLSGEHLNAAIEALERLNAVCGSRKVGVISHVERLRERIRTHIEVTREGHNPSTVSVVVNGGR